MDAVTAAISLVKNELEQLKKVFDKSCEERKKSLIIVLKVNCT